MRGSKNDNGIKIRRRIKAFYYGLRHSVRYAIRYARNVNSDYYASEENFLPILISNYHVIEKCLAMPNFELGHAKERVSVVCCDLLKWRDLGFNLKHVQIVAAIQSVKEYNNLHKKANYQLGSALQNLINEVIELQYVNEHLQPTVKSEEFFEKSNGAFNEFAKSRHSCRAYSDKDIPLDVLRDCVDIARTTPTACNRQPNKTYLVTKPELISEITRIQGGGRGFAEKSNKLIIITSSLTVFNTNEIFEAIKSGGMYTMNILYALHYHKIGACPLLWGEDKKKDKKLRKLLDIPDNEKIIMVISCGYPLDEFKYVTSVRNPVEDSLVVE